MAPLANRIADACPKSIIYVPNGPLPSRVSGFQHFEIEAHYRPEQFAKPAREYSGGEAGRMQAIAADADRFVEPYNRLLGRLAMKHSVPSERVAIVGFSQGGQMALQMVRNRADRLGAVVSISGSLLPTSCASHRTTRGTPILLTHGSSDTVLPIGAMSQAQTSLENDGFPVTTLRIEGGDHHNDWKQHAVPAASDFIRRHLGGSALGPHRRPKGVSAIGTHPSV